MSQMIFVRNDSKKAFKISLLRVWQNMICDWGSGGTAKEMDKGTLVHFLVGFSICTLRAKMDLKGGCLEIATVSDVVI